MGEGTLAESVPGGEEFCNGLACLIINQLTNAPETDAVCEVDCMTWALALVASIRQSRVPL
jgi:hypothetical protein